MFDISARTRVVLLAFAVLAFIGPNGLFLYAAFTEPALIQEANANPVALAFMIEAMMLLVLFLGYVWTKTRSAGQVALYLGLSFIGSLAFSFPFFLYQKTRYKTNAQEHAAG